MRDFTKPTLNAGKLPRLIHLDLPGLFYARWINHDAIGNPAFTDRAAFISKYTSNFGTPR